MSGKDGSGGQAAFWLVRVGEQLTHQPVVFLGCEGETGVVARNLDGYLWLLAAGLTRKRPLVQSRRATALTRPGGSTVSCPAGTSVVPVG